MVCSFKCCHLYGFARKKFSLSGTSFLLLILWSISLSRLLKVEFLMCCVKGLLEEILTGLVVYTSCDRIMFLRMFVVFGLCLYIGYFPLDKGVEPNWFKL